MCPMTYAARAMDAHRFALWSGIIQAFGNCGMLLSRQPARAAGGMARAGGPGSGPRARWRCSPSSRSPRRCGSRRPMRQGHRSLWQDTREILAIAASPRLRALMVIAFASFAVVLGVRGLWGGPWLMEAKGLPACRPATCCCWWPWRWSPARRWPGVVQRWVGRPVALLAGSHLVVAGLVFLLVAGGPGGWLSAALRPGGAAGGLRRRGHGRLRAA